MFHREHHSPTARDTRPPPPLRIFIRTCRALCACTFNTNSSRAQQLSPKALAPCTRSAHHWPPLAAVPFTPRSSHTPLHFVLRILQATTGNVEAEMSGTYDSQPSTRIPRMRDLELTREGLGANTG